MKYRDYKIFRAGSMYHIFNRGNNKQDIFLSDIDYAQFLRRFALTLGTLRGEPSRTSRIKPLPLGSFSVVCYCLMPNHVHFLIKQNGEIGIDKLLLKVMTSYAIYFNKKYDRVGNVFQDAFKAKLVDNDAYATYVSAYIHNNPVEPLNYQHSSLMAVLGLKDDRVCDKDIILSWFDGSAQNYHNFIKSYQNEDIESDFE